MKKHLFIFMLIIFSSQMTMALEDFIEIDKTKSLEVKFNKCFREIKNPFDNNWGIEENLEVEKHFYPFPVTDECKKVEEKIGIHRSFILYSRSELVDVITCKTEKISKRLAACQELLSRIRATESREQDQRRSKELKRIEDLIDGALKPEGSTKQQ